MRIPKNILAILANCRIEENTLFLPPEQLDRKTYTAVNKCIENIGGKWNRKAKGHVFDHDPTDGLENLLMTGETEDMKRVFQFFPTPREVALQMCEMAGLTESSRVLEPSVGKGDLADVVWEQGVSSLLGVELNNDMQKYLKDKPYTTITGVDFVEIAKEAAAGQIKRDFTHVIMNPPFSRQQDIDHIVLASELLAPGGTLVSVASTSWQWRDNSKSQAFRDWLSTFNAEVEEISAGAFKESGTMIPTVIIKLIKEVEHFPMKEWISTSNPPHWECQVQAEEWAGIKMPELLEPGTVAKATEPENQLSFIEKFRLSKAS